MTPGRDTEPTPIRRGRRESLATVAARSVGAAIRTVVPYVTAFAVALLVAWTARVERAAERAQGTAAVAAAQGVTGAAVATETKVEAAAGYDATKEKADATGQVIAELAAELKALREEVERLKAVRGRRPRVRAPVRVPPVVTEPLPETPAAAAAEKAAAPGG